jgi:hypothetical protein
LVPLGLPGLIARSGISLPARLNGGLLTGDISTRLFPERFRKKSVPGGCDDRRFGLGVEDRASSIELRAESPWG